MFLEVHSHSAAYIIAMQASEPDTIMSRSLTHVPEPIPSERRYASVCGFMTGTVAPRCVQQTAEDPRTSIADGVGHLCGGDHGLKLV